MPKPSIQNLLVDVQCLPQGENGPDFGTNTFDKRAKLVVHGVLHRALVLWSRRQSRWLIKVHPVGFGTKQVHRQHKLHDFSLDGSCVEISDPEQIASASSHLSTDWDGDEHWGIAQPDTESSIPDPNETSVAPCFCLPILDTMNQGRAALREDDTWRLGISGLIIIPDPDNQSLYFRLGVYTMLDSGEDKPKFMVSYGNDGQDDLFMMNETRVVVIA